MLYFDTSAILPYYREEQASARVEALLRAQTTPVLISHLTQVEFASGLARWVRTDELTDPMANRIESAFHDDLSQGRFKLCAMESAHFQRAFHWLATRKTSLRTLDALHLAIAEAHQARLISEDDALLQAAHYFGIDAGKA